MKLRDAYLTITQAAEDMHVSRQTISRWVKEGKLPIEKVGREKLIAKKDLESFKKAQKASQLGLLLWSTLLRYLDYFPKKAEITGVMMAEPLRAIITKPDDTKELIEISYINNNKGKTIGFKCKRVKKFRTPIMEASVPDVDVDMKASKSGYYRMEVDVK